MVDIREWWPDIQNSDIDAIGKYTNYELLILRRMVNKIGGGTEIYKKDLLQSLSSDKLGEGKKAIDSLVKAGVLRAKPKTNGIIVYQVDPKHYTEPLKIVLDIIRRDKNFREALKAGSVTFIKTSEVLETIFKNSFRSHEYCQFLKIRPSEQLCEFKNNDKEELGIIIELEFKCKKCNRIENLEFQILNPQSIRKSTDIWECKCGTRYNCTTAGELFIVS